MKNIIAGLAVVTVAAASLGIADANAAGKLITRGEAARNCTENVIYVYRSQPAPRWSCKPDWPGKGTSKAFNIIEPSETDKVVKHGGIAASRDKCEQKTDGFRKLKGITKRGDFVCAGKPGTDVLEGLDE